MTDDHQIAHIQKSFFSSARNRLALYSLLFLLIYSTFVVALLLTDSQSESKSKSPIGIDFAVYYTTGQMVISGDIDHIYDVPRHHAVLEKVLGRETPFLLSWVYPPTYLLAIVPFSFLPFYVALILWNLTTLLLAGWAIYLLVPGKRNLSLLIFGFPGVLMNLRWGQNGFLNTALLGFGLYFSEKSALLSGLMFGLLTYKPQIALFPLLILLITKKWRIFAWSIFFSLLTALISCLIFGIESWVQFVQSFSHSTAVLLEEKWRNFTAIQPSLYTVFRMNGLGEKTSYLILGLIGVVFLLITWWTFRQNNRLSLRGSVFVLGIFLTMPYYIQYDLMILSIPLILLSYDCLENGYHVVELFILFALWMMPLINWPIVYFTGVQISPIVLLIVMAMTILRVKQSQKDHSHFNAH